MNTNSPRYRAIADNTRRQILDLLREKNMTAGDIVLAVTGRSKRMTQPAVSKHLRILRRSKLVTVKRNGREQIYSLNPGPLREIDTWLKQYEVFWDQQLQSFKNYVENEKGEQP
jgi:DNA-binding transcriptional ArsR family regulator